MAKVTELAKQGRTSTVGANAVRKGTTGEGGDPVVSSEDEANFQVELWRLLEKQVALFTLGESTSLPEYDAYRLLASACYVLGVDPDLPNAASMQAIVTEGAEAVFSRRLAILEQQVARTELLWKEVCLNMPLLDSVALKDTLESLKNFNVRYEPRFFAHEIPADIDYPLSDPVCETLQGADYVAEYLERLLLECMFLQQFNVADCHQVLRAVHPQYGELILNLFEPVAANAIGCALAGCDVRGLQVDEEAQRRISGELEGRSRQCVERKLATASAYVCDSLSVGDDELQNYLTLAASKLAPRLMVALQHHTLRGVFMLWPREGEG